MLRVIGLALMISVVSGCATQEYCADREFFKPTVIDGKSTPNRYFPNVAAFELSDDILLRLSICRKSDALCVEVYPKRDVVLRFLETKVGIKNKNSNKEEFVKFKQITYTVPCHGPTLSEKDANCRSTNESPIVGNEPIEKRLERAEKIGANFFFMNTYMFSPDAAFKGVDVPVALRTFRSKYEVMTDVFDLPLNQELMVRLPKMQVGSATVTTPDVAFRWTKETVCLPNRPLSLQ